MFVHRQLAFHVILVCFAVFFVSSDSNLLILLLLENASHKVHLSLKYFARFSPTCFKLELRPAISSGRLFENMNVRQVNSLDLRAREIQSILFPLARCR